MAKTRQQPAAGQDEADIVSSLGAEPVDPDDPTGPLVADEDAVRAAGAVDTESIRANSISNHTVNRKRGGEKNVTINEPLLQKYETITRLWPVNSLSILVKRLTGTQIEWPITSQPKNAVELYAAIKALHGRHEEATYEVFIRDSQIKANRGTGRITMPDTRDEVPPQPQLGQPMQPPPYYPQQPYPQGYPQQQPYAAPGYPQPIPQQPPQPGQPAPPPAVVHVQPAQNDPSSMIGVMQQMFEMFQRMQAAAQPQQPQQQQPVMPPPPQQNDPASMMAWMQQVFEMFRQVQASAQPHPAPQQQPMMPMPPPPQSNDPASMMAWMQQMFQMFQQVQASAQPPQAGGRGGHQQPQQQPMVNPMAAMMGVVPPVQPPPGMVFVPGWGMVSMEALAQAQAQAAGVGGGRPGPYGRRPPYYGGGQGPGAGDPSQPPYQAGGYPQQGYPQQPGAYPPHPQPPPPPKSMAEQFREATSVIHLATEIADQFRPQVEPQAPPAPAAPEPDDSPIKVIDTGPAKIVINKDNGSARFWETLVTNSPGIFKWVGEQAEAIQKAANEREAAKRRAQQLPPGFVEVGPGYVPPPGYVAVPEMPPQHALPPQQQPPVQQQPPLPPPPAQMPPPINQQPQAAPAQRRTWDLPGVTR